MKNFLKALEMQRWDDHRYYHHSRINQTLHLISAVSFLVAYVTLFTDPVKAAFIGWLISMVTRQSGHFFFEPKGFDTVNGVSHEYKEEVKVGYNLNRKVVLLALWIAIPALVYLEPSVFGLFEPFSNSNEFLHHVGTLWLGLGVVGLLFRTLHLFFIKDVQTGLVWMTKILTDPFNDIKLYYKSPFYLMKGQLISSEI